MQKYDSIVTAIIQKFGERAETGQRKYGTNLDRTDLKTLDWINHAQEELMDGILYLEKLKQETSKKDIKYKQVKHAIQCRRCLVIIESNSIHDYKQCPCGAVAIDGGISEGNTIIGRKDDIEDKRLYARVS